MKSNVPLPPAASLFDPAPETPIELESRIAEHAYAIWEQCGRPPGRALDHWLRAEQEIATESIHAQGLRAGPIITPTPPQGR